MGQRQLHQEVLQESGSSAQQNGKNYLSVNTGSFFPSCANEQSSRSPVFFIV